MKKAATLCLSLVLLLSLSLTALAAPDGFISSPSGNPAPTIIDFIPANDDCTATAVITSYGDRHNLPDALRTMLEKAYSDITNAGNITELNTALAQLVEEKQLNSSKLVVSDLFDIHVTGCDYHSEHRDFDITLAAETLKHFVALLHMNAEGVWEIVADATVVSNGEHLQFSVDAFSPFAIVVDTTSESGDTPPTGNNGMIYLWGTLVVAAGALLILICYKTKKQKA
ncbi:MAG: hypothetical protein IKM04_07870 [Clostridia bacterium]|nr:hypothetical protein [Clostridia bacterium]